MVDINFARGDDFFHDMENELKKIAYISLMDYEQTLQKMNCDQLKDHNPERARVPAENFEKIKVYKKVLAEKKCSPAANKTAVDFAIQYIAKVADELDKNGFIEVANVLDGTLQKFAMLDCEDCK